MAAVCLPHDWLTWRLGGAAGLEALATDRGDASGTGYWSPATGSYRARPAPARPRGTRRGSRPCSARPPAPADDHGRGGARPRDRRQHGRRARRWAPGPGTWSSRSAPPARCSPSPSGRPPTRPASWPGSPTPPAGSCRWSAPSTPPGCWTPPPRMLGGRPPSGCPSWPWRPGRRRRAGPGPLPGGRAHPEPAATPPGRCTASAWPPPPRPTWPGRRSRGCCAGSPTAWTRWSPRASRSSGCCWSAAGPARRRCAGSPRPCSAARWWSRRRASTSPTAPPARPPGSLAGGAEPPGWELAGTETYEAEPAPAVRERYAACRDLTIEAERDNNAASPDTIAADRVDDPVEGVART